jgi:phage terminase large subunit-like protein
MVAFTPASALRDGEAMTRSPDRVDALVWAATELFPDIVAAERVPAPRVEYSVGGWMG